MPSRFTTKSFRGAHVGLISLALVGITAAIYLRVGGFEYLNFDDPAYVTGNHHINHGFTWVNARWAFTALEVSNWHPLTWLSHMADCQLFGMRAGPAHLVNLALHLANTFLLFLFLQSTTAALWRSALVSALFALHPLHVETVAWISERKDVLSAFFFFLTLLAYARYARKTDRGCGEAQPRHAQKKRSLRTTSALVSSVAHSLRFTFYVLALACFTLGLLSKPMLVTTPFVLLLLDYWPLRRLFQPQLRLCILEKLPFFSLAAACSVLTVVAQNRGGSLVHGDGLPFLPRILNAIIAYATYLAKTIWPIRLACFYEFRLDLPAWQILLSAAVLAALSAFVWVTRRQKPWLIFGWLWYVGMLVPVIGLIQVGTQSMADRYTYLPLVGVFIMLVWGLADFFQKLPVRRWLAITALAVIFACAALTSHQLNYWRNSVALFTHAVEVRPDAALSHLNLGHARLLGGRADEAIPQFQEALRLMPSSALAELNWANASRLQGNPVESLVHYRAALEMQTNFPEAHFACANLLVSQGNLPEAESHYLAALRQKPDFPAAHNNLGNLYELIGQYDQAVAHYSQAVALDPDYAEGHYYLGGALARQNKITEALAQLRTAVKLNPDYALALNDLAWVLATAEPAKRDLGEATKLAEHACQVTSQKDVNALGTLATVYAQSGRFSDAANAAAKALSLARQSSQNDAVAILETQLAAYRDKQTPQPVPIPRAPLSPP